MCRNQHDPHLERELAALQEARRSDGFGESQEESGTEQVVQSRNYRPGRNYVVLDKLRADSTTAR